MRRGRRLVTILVFLVSVLVMLNAALLVLTIRPAPEPTGGAVFSGGTVGFTYISGALCFVPISRGWTLVSLCMNTTQTSIPVLMQNVDYRFVMAWNTTSQDFVIYSPLAADPPFTDMQFNTSYFIYLNNPSNTQFGLNGKEVEDLNISLVSGWNAPGFPYVFNSTILKYFNESRHRYLMKWNTSAQEFVIYSPRAATPAFTTINRSEGQMLNSYVNTSLYYNKSYLQG